MNKIADLVASAKTVHGRYDAGGMDRHTVIAWITRLGTYSPPHGDCVRLAADWFRSTSVASDPEELKQKDLSLLAAIITA